MYLTMGKLTNESGMLLDSTLWGSHQSTSSLPSSRGNQPPLPPPNCWAPPMGFCLHIQIAWMRLQSVWRFPTRNTIWGHGAPQFTGWLIKKNTIWGPLGLQFCQATLNQEMLRGFTELWKSWCSEQGVVHHLFGYKMVQVSWVYHELIILYQSWSSILPGSIRKHPGNHLDPGPLLGAGEELHLGASKRPTRTHQIYRCLIVFWWFVVQFVVTEINWTILNHFMGLIIKPNLMTRFGFSDDSYMQWNRCSILRSNKVHNFKTTSCWWHNVYIVDIHIQYI